MRTITTFAVLAMAACNVNTGRAVLARSHTTDAVPEGLSDDRVDPLDLRGPSPIDPLDRRSERSGRF